MPHLIIKWVSTVICGYFAVTNRDRVEFIPTDIEWVVE